jgi:hypothetical protein
MCLWVSYKKNIERNYFFASLKSPKKGVGSGVGSGAGSGSISQRYGTGDPDPDPDPHQNVTDPQHCFTHLHFICNRQKKRIRSCTELYCISISRGSILFSERFFHEKGGKLCLTAKGCQCANIRKSLMGMYCVCEGELFISIRSHTVFSTHRCPHT